MNSSMPTEWLTKNYTYRKMILSKTIGVDHDCTITIEMHNINDESDLEYADNAKIFFNDTNVTKFFDLIPGIMDDLISSVDWFMEYRDAIYELNNKNREDEYDY